MKSTILPFAAILALAFILSCSKDSSDSKSALELRADSVYNYVLHQHFIPVDFYSNKPIDYNQDDTVIDAITDLKPFILPYLSDDVIILDDNNRLHVDQGGQMYARPTGELQLPKEFDSVWKIETSKSKNEVYLQYLSYTYYQQRYTVDTFNETKMVAHVPWTSKIDPNDKALLYTRFIKQ